MYARLIYVPLDSRMSTDAIRNIVDGVGRRAAAARHRPRRARIRREVGPRRLPHDDDRVAVARSRTTRSRPTGRRRSRPGSARSRTRCSSSCSRRGTTGNPKGVMLAHDNVVAGVGSFHGIIKPMEHRLVSLLPLSHSLEQAVSPVLRDGRRRGHPLRPVAQPAGHLRQPPRAPGHDDAPRPPGARPVLERDRARGREAGPQRRRSSACAASPAISPTAARRLLFRNVHKQLGGGLRLFATAGAFLPPALQQAWEDMGVIVLQGYGATETAAGSRHDDGRPPAGLRRLAADAGRDADRRRRRDPVPRPDAVQGLLAQPRGDGRGVHRGRLVQERRPRAARRRRAGSTSTAARRTSSSCPTGSTCTRRTSRTRSASPASATRSPSRRGPGGSRRSCSGRAADRPRAPTRRRPS